MQSVYPRCPCGKLILPGRRYCSASCAGRAGGALRHAAAVRDRGEGEWCVYVSDLRQQEDELIRKLATEAQARDLARRLNGDAIARHGPLLPSGHPTPLYYVTQQEGNW